MKSNIIAPNIALHAHSTHLQLYIAPEPLSKLCAAVKYHSLGITFAGDVRRDGVQMNFTDKQAGKSSPMHQPTQFNERPRTAQSRTMARRYIPYLPDRHSQYYIAYSVRETVGDLDIKLATLPCEVIGGSLLEYR